VLNNFSLKNLVLLLFFLSTSQAMAKSITIDVGYIKNSQIAAQFTHATKYKSCSDIKQYSFQGSTRLYGESLLICQALLRGGIEPLFQFYAYPTNARALKELINGAIHLLFFSSWLNNQHENLIFLMHYLKKETLSKVFILYLRTRNYLQSQH